MPSSSPNMTTPEETIARCEETFGHRFQDRALLVEAITHSSFADCRVDSNERLEFLGDAILGFIVCEFLFHKFPDLLEGDMTKIKSYVVSRRTCGQIGKEMGLDKLLVVGKGVGSPGQVPASLLANAFESILGAIYLDGGMDAARTFLQSHIERFVAEAVEGGIDINFKSELQQYAQKRFGVPPSYHLLDDAGPDHSKWFRVAAQMSKKTFHPAWGKNKKKAEQKAAANALAELAEKEIPFADELPPGIVSDAK